MDALKKFIVWTGVIVTNFGMAASVLVSVKWIALIIVGLIIGWAGAIEWKEV